MSTSLDMSLDDLIRINKRTPAINFRWQRSASAVLGPGAARRFPNRSFNRSVPYSTTKNTYSDQIRDRPQVVRFSAAETGTKLRISNLEYSISEEDIKELFSDVGVLKGYEIHYDRSGRSKGTAEVVYTKRMDALQAVKRYNNVELDGKAMKIEMIETKSPTPVAIPLVPKWGFENPNGFRRSGSARGRGAGGYPLGTSRTGRIACTSLQAVVPVVFHVPVCKQSYRKIGISICGSARGRAAEGWNRGGGRGSWMGHGRGIGHGDQMGHGFGIVRGDQMGHGFARGRGHQMGHGFGSGHGEHISIADLDADLDKYRSGAMEIN